MMIEYIEIFRMGCIGKKLSVNYNRNQYIRIDKSVEEMAKIDIYFDDYEYEDEERIEDLELKGDENVIIYKYNKYSDLINIYGGIRIMITDKEMLREDRYKELPENIEYVIVKKKVYEVRKEEEMMRFMSNRRIKEYVEEMIRNGRQNMINKKGETVLYWLCKKEMEEEAIELISKMDEEIINGSDRKGRTILNMACENVMKRLSIELIGRMSDEAINREDIYGYMALNWACINMMGKVVLEIVRRMSDKMIEEMDILNMVCLNIMEEAAIELIGRVSVDVINRWNNRGETSLFWVCYNKMERVAIIMIEKMSESGINKWNKFGETALYYACHNKMEEVALKLISRMSIEAINKKGGGKRAIQIAEEKNMKKVVEMIKEVCI